MNGKKIGIMGGTFDPIHIAHLRLAETAYETFQLDQVIFVPAADPPHKSGSRITSYAKRADMVKAAIENNPHFICSDIEWMRKGYSYTSEILEWFDREMPGNSFYFIVGADSLFYMDDWHNPGRIFQLATVLAVTRGEVSMEQLEEKICFLREKFHARVYAMEYANLDISSHMIRALVAENRSIRYFVPDQVAKYIYTNRLYLNQNQHDLSFSHRMDCVTDDKGRESCHDNRNHRYSE